MSDFKTILKTRFYNRKTGQEINSLPVANNINLNIDIRNITSTFDFDFLFRISEKIEIKSHDFVEFYFNLPTGEEFQVFAGYMEDFVRETDITKLRLQANGRDFLGQLFTVPFLSPKPQNTDTVYSLVARSISNTYLREYRKTIKKKPQLIDDKGAYGKPILMQELAGSRMAPVIQQTLDITYNILYQDRVGRAVIWGRSSLEANKTNITLSDFGDQNVNSFQSRQNFSRAISEARVLHCSGEGNLQYNSQLSRSFVNTDERARNIFQPDIKIYNVQSLVENLAGVAYEEDKDRQAKAMIRKANQNLNQVVIKTSRPFWLGSDNSFIAYEVNQVWNIYSKQHNVNEEMRLAGIGYSQTSTGLNCQLLFIPKDTLV